MGVPARFLLLALALACGLGLLAVRAWADSPSAPPAAAPVSRVLVIATGGAVGSHHPAGVALGAAIGAALSAERGITVRTVGSTGAAESLGLLHAGRADLALVEALYARQAPFHDLRAVAVLWDDVEHFVLLRRNAATGTVADLDGLRGAFAVGRRGSAAEGSARAILEALKLDARGLEPVNLDPVPAVQAMLEGRVAGAAIPASPPVPAVTMVLGQLGPQGVRLLDFTDAQLEALRARQPVWHRHVIPAGTYPGQDAPVRTVAQPTFLACRASLPEDVAHAVTRAVFGNLDALREAHPALRALDLRRAAADLPVPLHPGAERALREAGAIP